MKKCSRCHCLKEDDSFILNERIFKLCSGCRKGKIKPDNSNKIKCSNCYCFKEVDDFKKDGYIMKTCNKCRTKKIKSEEIKEDLSNYKKHDLWKKIYNEKEFIDLNYILEMRKTAANCWHCGRPIQYLTYKPDFGQIKRINPKKGFIKGNVIMSCTYCMAR